MCRQNSCVHLSAEEAISAEERLLIYCKPVELYNILHRRALHNPIFLRRCLHYKMQGNRKRKMRAGIVIFNYRDNSHMLQKTEVTEDFSCPFCMMQCASFKGLRYHLCSSHDLFHFDFWVKEEYQAVNVYVKLDSLRSETVASGVDLRLQTFSFCSKPRKRRPKDLSQNAKISIQFLELDSPSLACESMQKEPLEKDGGERACESFPSGKGLQNGLDMIENCGSDYPNSTECVEHLAAICDVPSVSIAMAQSPVDPECVKSLSGCDPAVPAAKTRKLSAERSEPRNRMLLQKRQFYHSHRVQPMALEQVMSDQDSEDEVDDDIADLEDRRMLDDFVDVSKDEKQLMHMWNSFVRKQRVIADGHVPWACEAFSRLHGKELVNNQPLFWCWKFFMIKLWNHGLVDACTFNNCSLILERFKNEGSDAPSASAAPSAPTASDAPNGPDAPTASDAPTGSVAPTAADAPTA